MYKSFVSAEESPGRNMMMRKVMSKACILKDIIKSKCTCSQNCLRTVTAKEVKVLRHKYWTKPGFQRNQWLIHTVSNTEVKGRFRCLQTDNGKKVVTSAFLKIYHINKNKLTKCSQLQEEGAISSKGKQPRQMGSDATEALAWLEDYASFYGDRMPHNKAVLLPYKTQKQLLYSTYKRERGGNAVSLTTFYKLWKQYLPQLKIKKVCF